MIITQKRTTLNKIITTFLALIMTFNNNFIFNSKFYLQIKDCAMGTISAPSYANIFMSEFEEKYIYPLIKNKSIIYLRYIDETFMVWIKSESKLSQFMNEINQKHQTWSYILKKKYRIFGHINVHGQQQQTPDHPLQKIKLTVKTNYMLNRHTCSHLKKASFIVRPSELNERVLRKNWESWPPG